VKDPRSFGPLLADAFQFAGALIVGMPFMLAGILLCATIVGIPVGLALIGLSGSLLAWVNHRRVAKMQEWHSRCRPMDNEEVPPWVMGSRSAWRT